MERIIPIYGDLSLEGLGILPETRALLIEELDIIMNGAASLSFTEPFKQAL